MRVYAEKTYDDMSKRAASVIAAQVVNKPDCVLGLATGSSPVGTYKKLVEWYNAGDIDFSQVKSVNLDEYVGLDGSNDQSYRYFMDTNFFNHVNIDKNNTYVPQGTELDEAKACGNHEAIIKKLGGVDLQLLGIGRNGHIGFNEPDDHFTKDTHRVDLTPSTIEANARFFANEDEVPKQAYSMGIRTILSAKKILIVASGEDKAEAIAKSFFGPITPEVPGSVLQLHPDVTLVADAAALSKVKDIADFKNV
ncbi:MAG: glucosamine-6-phosphate deaminase [Pseudobutyrivibrio sp.]|nr:glucosamine-6-phosphate deaminase [Pseudobutyrivibrio sp.]